jgi:hypothetical protein
VFVFECENFARRPCPLFSVRSPAAATPRAQQQAAQQHPTPGNPSGNPNGKREVRTVHGECGMLREHIVRFDGGLLTEKTVRGGL